MVDSVRPTKKQKELLNFIEGFIASNGYGPSYREIMRSLNYKSVSTVAKHVDGLIAKGLLRKRDNSARSLEVCNGTIKEPEVKSQVSASQEKWLVNLISKKFSEVENAKKPNLVDELYVLVGALQILGLDNAAMAAKSRLLDIVKKSKIAANNK